MSDKNNQAPGLGTLLGRLARTGLGAIQNRSELLAVEWQEEKARLSELLVWIVGFLFLAMMGAMMLTAFIIFLFRPEWRVYVAAAFAVLYLGGAAYAWAGLKGLLKQEPFVESIDQVKRDAAWLDSLK